MYSTTAASSHWWANVSASVALARQLPGARGEALARVLAGDALHVLIDLNGLTLGGSADALAYRVAAVQVRAVALAAATRGK